MIQCGSKKPLKCKTHWYYRDQVWDQKHPKTMKKVHLSGGRSKQDLTMNPSVRNPPVRRDCLLRFPDPFCMKKHSISPTGYLSSHVTKYCHCHEKWLFLAVPLLFLSLLDCSFELPFLTWLFNLLFLKSPYSGTQLNYFWQIGEHHQPEAANLLNWVSDPIRRKSGNSTEADIDHWHIFRHLF